MDERAEVIHSVYSLSRYPGSSRGHPSTMLGNWYRVAPAADESWRVLCDDGWGVAVHRYRPGATTRRHPVLLCHGLGANHITFDLAPEVSMARHLAEGGWDVWSVDLRGHGQSDRASLVSGRRRFDWSFDDHLTRDMPAALAHVLGQTGAPGVHWVGHSMGGMLIFAHLALAQGGIRSAVAMGASLEYADSDSVFHGMIPLLGLARVLKVLPFGALMRLMAPLAGRTHNRLEAVNAALDNVAPELVRRLYASVFNAIPSTLLEQLATAFAPGGLRSRDGGVVYAEGLRRVRTPIVSLAGTRDRQCPPAAARSVLARLPPGPHQLAVHEGYGHFDLVVGRHAPLEVHPTLHTWLEAHD